MTNTTRTMLLLTCQLCICWRVGRGGHTKEHKGKVTLQPAAGTDLIAAVCPHQLPTVCIAASSLPALLLVLAATAPAAVAAAVALSSDSTYPAPERNSCQWRVSERPGGPDLCTHQIHIGLHPVLCSCRQQHSGVRLFHCQPSAQLTNQFSKLEGWCGCTVMIACGQNWCLSITGTSYTAHLQGLCCTESCAPKRLQLLGH
jgi:hypothetical protein